MSFSEILPGRTIEKLSSGKRATIVAFGDSITEGDGVERGFPFFWSVALRERFPGAELKMVNSGVSGDTTFDAVGRFNRDVAAHKPDLVSVQFGINDCYSTVYRSEFRENIQWIILRIQEETDAEIILVTSVMPKQQYDQDALVRYYDVVRQFASDYKTSLVELDALWLRIIRGAGDFDALTLPDGIHPSEEGYRVIAGEFMRLFE